MTHIPVTRHEYFAAMAMQQFIANRINEEFCAEDIAFHAYAVADNMEEKAKAKESKP